MNSNITEIEAATTADGSEQLPPAPTLNRMVRPEREAALVNLPPPVKWLTDAMSKVASGEGRNETGMWLAAQLRDDGFSLDQASGIMEHYVELVPDLDHPYNFAEAQATLRSVYRREKRMPAGQSPASRTTLRKWPTLEADALYGLAGDVVNEILPHSEADAAALLTQFLAMIGNVVGRKAYWTAEADEHFGNLFVMLVGRSSKGRKGTSLGQIKNLVCRADFEWAEHRWMSGLSSGEGLIEAVRDARTKQQAEIGEDRKPTGNYVEVVEDAGIRDKRLVVVQSEFASVLKVMEREGNILSAIIRQAWDDGDLRVMTKTKPTTATNAHISIIGHITIEDLSRFMKSTDTANGFANRFLWICSDRSKSLPDGGRPDSEIVTSLSNRISSVIEFSRERRELRRDAGARELWVTVYDSLTDGRVGLFGAATSRAEAQVMRLAMLYALCDLATEIRREHLEAALALWRYAEASAKFIFGNALGNKIADTILAELDQSPDGLTRSMISREILNKNVAARDIDAALELLHSMQLAFPITQETGGRPAEVWHSFGG